MEPEGSLPYSEEPSTSLYPEPDKSSPYHTTLRLYNPFLYYLPIYILVFLVVLAFWLSQYPICLPPLPHSCYMSCPSHPRLDHSNYNLNYWVMHPTAHVSININKHRHLLRTEVSIYIDSNYTLQSKLQDSSLCNSLHPPATSFVFSPNDLLSIVLKHP
jgi:hypothetical protein